MFTCNAQDISKILLENIDKTNPSVTASEGGRLFISYQMEKAVLVIFSEDGGKNWSSPIAAATVCDGETVFDSRLWVDPQNRLWFIWSVMPSNRVECVICSSADADTLEWSDVRSLDFGLLLARPIVSLDGSWLFLSGVTDKELAARDTSAEGKKKGLYLYETRDCGETFSLRSKPFGDRTTFDAISTIEKVIYSRVDGEVVGKPFFVAYAQVSYGIAKFVSPDGGVSHRAENDSTFGSYFSQFDVVTVGDPSEKKFVLVNNMHFAEGGRMCLTALTSNTRGDSYQGVLELEAADVKGYTPDIVPVGDSIYVVYSRENAVGRREIALARFTEQDARAYKLVDPDSYLGRKV